MKNKSIAVLVMGKNNVITLSILSLKIKNTVRYLRENRKSLFSEIAGLSPGIAVLAKVSTFATTEQKNH
jgi:hypothetical protein